MKGKVLRALGLLSVVLFIYSCDSSTKEIEENKAVDVRFEKVKELAKHRGAELFGVFEQNLSEEESYALKFLYSFMPLSDLADYDGEFFLDHVKTTLMIRKNASWGDSIPDDIFYHFVMPHRVNNENLDSSRIVFYNELKPRIFGMSMYEAALEINHWCHEKVEYQPTDERTSAPLATVKSAFGRCGEESTFLVSALRSVCIPARQVYVPRWAHSDDNHAWVEVWADGQWYFLGACEPEPVLNLGWFNVPASRSILVHSRVFGVYKGNEEINSVNDKFTNINVTPRYAKTVKQFIRVVDINNKPVKGATVEFQLYNYAEFYPLTEKQTDKNGLAYMTTGIGDLLIWAYRDKNFGFSKVTMGEKDTVTIVLNNNDQEDLELFFWPPQPTEHVKVNVTEEMKEKNKIRFAKEDSMRNAYVGTFISNEKFNKIASEKKLDPSLFPFLEKSKGNYDEILAFIGNFDDGQKHWLNSFLGTLSDKDLRDTKAAILDDHISEAIRYAYDYLPEDFINYIMAPRIGNEMLVPYRAFLREKFGRSFITKTRNDVNKLVNWVKDSIRINDDEQTYNLPITPVGVYKLRVADRLSRDIFFVAVCRSFGIPARLEPGTKTPQYFWIEKWVDVKFDGNQEKQEKKYKISFENGNYNLKFKPQYYHHFTLARFEENKYKTLELEYYADFDKLGKIELAAGKYMLLTSNRLESGKILVNLDFFEIKGDMKIKLKLPDERSDNIVYGKIDMNREIIAGDGKPQKISDLNNGKNIVIGIISPGEEPSKHTLNDIQLVKKELEKTGAKLLLIMTSANKATFSKAKYPNLPAETYVYVTKDNPAMIFNSGVSAQMPLFLVIRPNGEVIYKNEGYKIGIGNDLLKKL